MVLCENPMCISKEKLGNYLTKIDDGQLLNVAIAYTLATSLVTYIDESTLLNVRKQALNLNLV